MIKHLQTIRIMLQNQTSVFIRRLSLCREWRKKHSRLLLFLCSITLPYTYLDSLQAHTTYYDNSVLRRSKSCKRQLAYYQNWNKSGYVYNYFSVIIYELAQYRDIKRINIMGNIWRSYILLAQNDLQACFVLRDNRHNFYLLKNIRVMLITNIPI